MYDQLSGQSKESVVRVDGRAVARSAENVNPELPTGEVEVEVTSLEVLGAADPLPFPVFPEDNANEEMRLTNRFLDLRRQRMHRNIMLRTQVISFLRREMTALGFNEMATPILSATSPEGARDFLVPSRVRSRPLLRAAAGPPAVQASADDLRLRPLLPDRALLP